MRHVVPRSDFTSAGTYFLSLSRFDRAGPAFSTAGIGFLSRSKLQMIRESHTSERYGIYDYDKRNMIYVEVSISTFRVSLSSEIVSPWCKRSGGST